VSAVLTQFDVDASAETVWQALTTPEGIRGWWTTQADVPGGVGSVVKLRFPNAPNSWDLRIDDADENELLRWHCVGGPPPWIDTDIVFRLASAPDGATRVIFDHLGWKDAEEMVRVVTFGWVQMFLRLKSYAESGEPKPFFDF
jgi:uncharacterized protein YndB with AHSA1/START domain